MTQLSTIGNELVHALRGDDGQEIVTEIRLKDGFVNATKLCKSAGKFWADYYKNKRTQMFLTELIDNMNIFDGNMKKINGNMKITIGNIVQSEVGGNHEGTWVHPDVAVDLASWCSAKFQVAIAKLVRTYMCGELTTKDSKEAGKALQQRLFITDYAKKNVVYVGLVDTEEFEGGKVGYTDDIIRREKEHKNDMGNFKLVKVYETMNNRQVERDLLAECQSRDVRTSAYINGKNQTELIKLDDEFTLESLLELVETIVEKTKTQMIEDIKNDIALEYQKEKTKEIESKVEVCKILTGALSDFQEQMKEKEKIKQQMQEYELKVKEIEEKKHFFEEKFKEQQRLFDEQQKKLKDQEEAIEKLKKETGQEEINEVFPTPQEELEAFFEKCCEFGQDISTDRYRVICDDLYSEYCKRVTYKMTDYDLKTYIKNTYKIDYKAANWYNQTKYTWFNLRLKDFVTKKKSIVQRLIYDFVNDSCGMGEDYKVDTKILYDKFEDFSKEKGLETIKQNGFTRHIFKKELLLMFPSVKVKEFAIGGKKHAFTGLKLLNSDIQLPDAVRVFVNNHCVFGPGLKVKTKVMYEAFAKLYDDSGFSRVKFHSTFREQNPDIIKRCITKSEHGYIGITLRLSNE